MLKPFMTLLLAVTIFWGWTAFTGDQAAAAQPLNQRSDGHYGDYGYGPPPGNGYGAVRHPRPCPPRFYYPVRHFHPYPGYYAPYFRGHRPYPTGWHYGPPPFRPYHYHGGY